MKSSQPILLSKAIALSLGELNQPVVSKYQLGVLIYHLYLSTSYHGSPIGNLKLNSPDLPAFNYHLKKLLELGIITPSTKLKSSVFNILGKESNSPAEIACSIDPFAYISHLSAMEYHGITDRLPKILFLSTPEQRKWREFAQDRMLKDLKENLDDYLESRLPKLARINFEKIGATNINRYSSLHYGAYKSVKDSPLRVSTIGRTFLDMLRAPNLCGGIYHVIEVYQEYTPSYLNLITDEIDRHGKSIDKVRAGYILEEKCNVQNNPAIESWQKYVQRGGSRKLDITQEYSPNYSERWCLSLNIFE
ncbi:MAG: hypothetical protein KQH63_04465 [Desulfobulbaceae bacterium]|nr:hypothetical protein [Desulfobulbaceae bacterium]